MRLPRRMVYYAVSFVLLTYIILYATSLTKFTRYTPGWSNNGRDSRLSESLNISTVVASRIGDDTVWLPSFFPNWTHAVYTAENLTGPSSATRSKGNEATVYLTHLIDNYDSLPDIIIFLHANRYQWHNDDPLYDNVRVLSRLQLSYVEKEGYVNLRCAWRPGCPSETRPFEAATGPLSDERGLRTGPFFAGAFKELLPDLVVPDEVGVACCAQFALSRERILRRPKDEYQRLRQWLYDTDLQDRISGRIFEYLWHSKIILHLVSVSLSVFCDLRCHEQGACESHPFPKYSTLPEGWPWYDWEGQWQNATNL